MKSVLKVFEELNLSVMYNFTLEEYDKAIGYGFADVVSQFHSWRS